jgi:hypothetical protein
LKKALSKSYLVLRLLFSEVNYSLITTILELIDIADVAGKKVFTQQTKNIVGLFNTSLPVDRLGSGIYFVSIQLGETVEVLKLQVTK